MKKYYELKIKELELQEELRKIQEELKKLQPAEGSSSNNQVAAEPEAAAAKQSFKNIWTKSRSIPRERKGADQRPAQRNCQGSPNQVRGPDNNEDPANPRSGSKEKVRDASHQKRLAQRTINNRP